MNNSVGKIPLNRYTNLPFLPNGDPYSIKDGSYRLIDDQRIAEDFRIGSLDEADQTVCVVSIGNHKTTFAPMTLVK